MGLREKYAYAISTAKGRFDGSAQERDGKLHFVGTVRSEADKNEIWNAIKTIPDWKQDIVEQGDTAVLLDMGQGSFASLWRYMSPAKVSAVVISHMHADHNVDLVPLRHWARYGHKGSGPKLYGPTDLRALDRLLGG